jgi:hypothetical protein
VHEPDNDGITLSLVGVELGSSRGYVGLQVSTRSSVRCSGARS